MTRVSVSIREFMPAIDGDLCMLEQNRGRAPGRVKESLKATGTDGIPDFGHKKSRLEGQLFFISNSTRVGSSTVDIGARRGT